MSSKYTKQLLNQINASSNDMPIEVIIRVSAPSALERTNDIEEEMQHTQQLMASLVSFLTELERNGANVKLLGTSWLTHSVLATASPMVLRKLTKRDDVDLIDINAEIGIGNNLGRNKDSLEISPFFSAAQNVT